MIFSGPEDIDKAEQPHSSTTKSAADEIQAFTAENTSSHAIEIDDGVSDRQSSSSVEHVHGEDSAYLSDSGSAPMDLDSDDEEQNQAASNKESRTLLHSDGREEDIVSSPSREAMLDSDIPSLDGNGSREHSPPPLELSLLSNPVSIPQNASNDSIKNIKPGAGNLIPGPAFKRRAPGAAPKTNVSSNHAVKWGPTTKKNLFLPTFKNEPFIIFFCETEKPGFSGDDSHQARHVYLPEILVSEHTSAIVDLFVKKHDHSARFDLQDTICWDPKISTTQKPHKERSVYILEFIKHQAEHGNDDAIALQEHPTKIWGLFLHWWRYVKDGSIASISCPWEKERALKMAAVLGADAAYIDVVERCQVRAKKYDNEEEDMMWMNHTHPDWLYLYDIGRYNMLKKKGKLWERGKV
ncbi:hypothetical protein DL98DRAFT_636402 [Cadophora sp. DSE1049]|nr:hypothetical protein DL98DRAFT_636402 [Cadophora sp. DSE1049]